MISIIFSYSVDFVIWAFFGLIRIGVCYVYYHYVVFNYLQSYSQEPSWRLYAKALQIALIVSAFFWLMTGVTSEYDPYDDSSYLTLPDRPITLRERNIHGLRIFTITAVLSICAVYRRHSPAMGSVSDIFKEPKTYIGIIVGALLALYWSNHDIHYASWENFLDCYNERKEISLEIKEYRNRKDKYFKKYDSSEFSEENLRDFGEIDNMRNQINEKGRIWMEKCFYVRTRSQGKLLENQWVNF